MASAFKCAIFDLDGVVTETARLHSMAWKAMFDQFLQGWYRAKGEPFREFTDEDYLRYVDGKPRYQGVKSFFDSRGVDIPMGDPEDTVDRETCCGLGNRKNVNFQAIIETQGADVFPTSVAFIRELKRRGIRVGVASSSKNTVLVLKKANLEDLFETRVCGLVSAELGLKGKPDPGHLRGGRQEPRLRASAEHDGGGRHLGCHGRLPRQVRFRARHRSSHPRRGTRSSRGRPSRQGPGRHPGRRGVRLVRCRQEREGVGPPPALDQRPVQGELRLQ